MKKMLLMATTLALACGVILGGLGSALAEETQSQYCRGLFGTVDNVTIDNDGNGTIVLSNVKPTSDNAATVEIKVNENTTYHIPTVTVLATGGAWQTWKQLALESRTLVVEQADRLALLLTEPAGDLTAQKVMVIPAKNLYRHRYQHRLGVVVGVDGDTATVAKRNGEQFTITLAEGAEVSEGQFVILVTDRLSGETQLRAVHAYRFQSLMERFEGYLEGSLTEEDFDAITEKLQAAHEKHIALLEQLQTRLEEQNRVRAAEFVGQAIQYCEARYAEAIQLRDQIRERIENAGGWEEWAAQWAVVSGNITDIDLTKRLITVDTEDGSVTLHVPLRASIVKDDYPFAFRSLEVGDVIAEAIYHKGTANEVIYIKLA
jgi:hypothetical protein